MFCLSRNRSHFHQSDYPSPLVFDLRRLAIRCFVSIRILCNFQVDLFCSEGRGLPISLWQPAQISFLLRVGFSRDGLFKCDGLL